MANSSKRARDSENSKRLAPSPSTHRANAHHWPYHNNLGTRHQRPVSENKTEVKKTWHRERVE